MQSNISHGGAEDFPPGPDGPYRIAREKGPGATPNWPRHPPEATLLTNSTVDWVD